ncbi:hypothetical protein [uncultured Treponema sp.]|uniref:hypothetical protein n=1 Tax=uncultured Treponema sp. TaxID=162155 RepID=UPI0025CD74CA|nr:hypothetical protein [uncultured Treponema sp.]
MKVNENFSAGATKKPDPLKEAIDSNFSQNSSVKTAQNPLPDARESVLAGEPAYNSNISQPAQNSSITGNAQSQIFNAPAAETKTPARREVKEKFLVSMSKGERSIFKAFCAMQNVSMNHFVMCAMDYFKEDLENGKVSLSSHSYKRKES